MLHIYFKFTTRRSNHHMVCITSFKLIVQAISAHFYPGMKSTKSPHGVNLTRLLHGSLLTNTSLSLFIHIDPQLAFNFLYYCLIVISSNTWCAYYHLSIMYKYIKHISTSSSSHNIYNHFIIHDYFILHQPIHHSCITNQIIHPKIHMYDFTWLSYLY